MRAVETLTQERLKEVLHYNGDTGLFTRKLSSGGVAAGTVSNNNASSIFVDGKLRTKKSLAVLYIMGAVKHGRLFFRNGDGSDFRFSNITRTPDCSGLTLDDLHEYVEYNEHSGIFVLKKKIRKARIDIGSELGCEENGYIVIGFGRNRYKAHRLAWFFVHGYMPEQQLDHINGNKSDNRLANLREASPSCNVRNQPISKSNSSGFTGVRKANKLGRYEAQIFINGSSVYLGIHDCVVEAALTRITCEDWCPEVSCSERNNTRAKLRELGYNV